MYALAEYPDAWGGLPVDYGPAPSSRMIAPYSRPFLDDYPDTRFPAPGSHRIYFDHGDATDARCLGIRRCKRRSIGACTRRVMGSPRMLSLSFPGTDHSEVSWASGCTCRCMFLLPPQT